MLTFEQYLNEENLVNSAMLRMTNGDKHLVRVEPIARSIAKDMADEGEALEVDGNFYRVRLHDNPSNKGRKGGGETWYMRLPSGAREKDLGDDVRVFSSPAFGVDEHIIAAKVSDIKRAIKDAVSGDGLELPDQPSRKVVFDALDNVVREMMRLTPSGKAEKEFMRLHKQLEDKRLELPEGPLRSLAQTHAVVFNRPLALPSQKQIISAIQDEMRIDEEMPLQVWKRWGLSTLFNEWLRERYDTNIRATSLAKNDITWAIVDPWMTIEKMGAQAASAAMRGKNRKPYMKLLLERGGRQQTMDYVGSGDKLHGKERDRRVDLNKLRSKVLDSAEKAGVPLTPLGNLDAMNERELLSLIADLKNVKRVNKAAAEAIGALSGAKHVLFGKDREKVEVVNNLIQRVRAAKLPSQLASLYPEIRAIRKDAGLPWDPKAKLS